MFVGDLKSRPRLARPPRFSTLRMGNRLTSDRLDNANGFDLFKLRAACCDRCEHHPR